LELIVDTSAWIHFLRNSNLAIADRVEDALVEGAAVTGTIVMELLAGARSEKQLSSLEHLLGRATLLPTEPEDFEHAARLYRTCRQNGITIRNMSDCLIAATAIRTKQTVLHDDRDFALLAKHTELQLAKPAQD
jgi:predicted nucleic acid-binding protein